MSPGKISAKVVHERSSYVRRAVASIRGLPISSREQFSTSPNTAAAAESYLRRGIESLLDLGRHVLAKGFARAPTEYKAIASDLLAVGVLDETDSATLSEIAGYRNRLVHFYDSVTSAELQDICVNHVGDLERLVDAIEAWVSEHPDRVDYGL